MKDVLFPWPYDDEELDRIARNYFDRMYMDGRFMEMLRYLILEGITLSTDGAYCYFPDLESQDPTDHFEGVEIGFGYPDPEAITVSEETFYRWLRIACDKYMALHPEDRQQVEDLLAKAPA